MERAPACVCLKAIEGPTIDRLKRMKFKTCLLVPGTSALFIILASLVRTIFLFKKLSFL